MDHLIEMLLKLIHLLFLPENDNDRSIVGESPLDRRAKWVWRCVLIGSILIAMAIVGFFYFKRGS